MSERRLLERISYWEQGAERSSQTQVDVLVRSISEHLKRLLNTRQGSVELDPLFGIPDFTNMGGSLTGGSTRDIEEAIRRMVQKYEPRLKLPRVTLRQENSDVLSIAFSLDGTVEVDQRDIALHLSTSVGANGKVFVA